MNYRPKMVDTSKVVLSEDLIELTEYLARNTHDTWAAERYAQGWKFGEERSDDKKEHPCLIPYNDLPESEKIFDRKTAMETIKTILALGYSVEVPEEKFHEGLHKSNKNLVKFLKSENVELQQLYHIWKEHDMRNWLRNVDLYLLACEKALEFGEPLLAYNIACEGEHYFPENVRLMQFHGLALARIGASEEANKVLMYLYNDFKDKSEETLGVLARTFKDLAFYEKDPAKKKEKYDKAVKFYRMSFELYESIWAGVNLASLFLMQGQKEKAAEQGKNIINLCKKNARSNDHYWLYATLGEANLIIENYDKAIKYYKLAMENSKKRVGVINTTRKNALLAMRILGTSLDIFRKIEGCLSVPKIVIFTGHRIDEADRESARFPKPDEKKVYQKILKYLKDLGPAVGYSSAANGADILFLEAMRELGNPCHIILPYGEEQFVKDSVWNGKDTSWESRYLELSRDSNNTVYVLKDQGTVAKGNSYEFANNFILGMAKLKASQLETLIYPFAVWHSDEVNRTSLRGGTTHTLKTWYRENEFIELIDLKNLDNKSRTSSLISTDFGSIKEEVNSNERYLTKGILFSDTVNYTSLTDDEFIVFEEVVLGVANKMIESKNYDIDYCNTWGDALHVIFSSFESTADFALDLNEKLTQVDWLKLGFRKELKMRIAVHAGQVIESFNPITNIKHYSGSNICRAARLEPLTPAGQVYCTQEFAAMLLAMGTDAFNLLYVGDLAMPKGFGIYPIFNIRRSPR